MNVKLSRQISITKPKLSQENKRTANISIIAKGVFLSMKLLISFKTILPSSSWSDLVGERTVIKFKLHRKCFHDLNVKGVNLGKILNLVIMHCCVLKLNSSKHKDHFRVYSQSRKQMIDCDAQQVMIISWWYWFTNGWKRWGWKNRRISS